MRYQASIYEREGDVQRAYLLLFRHAQLVLGHLSKHPEARRIENRLALVEAEKEVGKSLAKLEVLKPEINKRYERYLQHIRDRSRRTAEGETTKHIRDDASEHQSAFDAARDDARRQLTAGENRDLAVKLAHKEIQRRATLRRSTHEVVGTEDVVSDSRLTKLQCERDEQDGAMNDYNKDDNDLHRRIQDIRLQIDRSEDDNLRHDKDGPATRTGALRYPTVPDKSTYDPGTPFTLPSSAHELLPANVVLRPPKVPDLPRKVDLSQSDDLTNNHQGVPRPPPKSPIASSPTSDSRSATSTPIQTDLQPSTFTFKPAAYLENGQPLRTIFLPPELRIRFLSIASTNTRLNLETCGILCGTLISNALFISKLVIPDQESTSDTCDTINESDLFDYCDAEDLMVLGWIHTHPTQTCFMSSRDLHTHCGYQVMMPESIAIVCAPSRGE